MAPQRQRERYKYQGHQVTRESDHTNPLRHRQERKGDRQTSQKSKNENNQEKTKVQR